MARIYIIAGPPGIGKSTSGYDFIPDDIDILDADMISHRYKEQGFTDYKNIGNIRYQDMVRRALFSGNDFAIELNLGFQSHYDFIKQLKNFNAENIFHFILFFTDDIDICLNRAKQRFISGRHLVSPEVVIEMYNNTFPLLAANFKLSDMLTLVDVSASGVPKICGEWDSYSGKLRLAETLPKWVNQLSWL